LVDSDIITLLTHKGSDDGKGGYTVRSYFNPVVHRGLTIACLVCSDSYSDARCSNAEFHGQIKETFKKAENRTVLCIPAHLTSVDPRAIIDKWCPHFCIVAFSNCTENYESLIYFSGRYHEDTGHDTKDNWISLGRLDDCPLVGMPSS